MPKDIYFKFTFLGFLSLKSFVFANSSDASGPTKCILAWDVNAEEDLNGYEIYFSNSYSDFVLFGDMYVEELADSDNPNYHAQFFGGLGQQCPPAARFLAQFVIFYSISASHKCYLLQLLSMKSDQLKDSLL